MSDTPKKKLVLYTHADCKPCQIIKKLVNEGNADLGDAEEFEVVDIDTQEGFDRFEKSVLAKIPEDGSAQLPGAYMEGQACQIQIADDDTYVVINCGEPVPAEVTPQ